jgi:hypothetical protein
MRLFGWVGRRLSTSLMYAHGSCPFIRTDWIKLIKAAARLPARRLPASSQLLRPMVMGLIWFSIQLLSTGSGRRFCGQGSLPRVTPNSALMDQRQAADR